MQTIYLDISNKGVVPTVYAKQGDVGRRFLVVLTDSGIPYTIPAGSAFSVWYDGDSGDGNYTGVGGASAFVVNANTVSVELITQMLEKDGNGVLCLVLSHADGKQISSWNIPYTCEFVPGFESEEAKSYYTAFSETVENLQKLVETYPTVPAWAKQPQKPAYTAEEVGALPAIEDEYSPGHYYRMVDGEKEWINPPLAWNDAEEGFSKEYRTTERKAKRPVYVHSVTMGALPNNATLFMEYSTLKMRDIVSLDIEIYNNSTKFIAPFYYLNSANLDIAIACYPMVTYGADRTNRVTMICLGDLGGYLCRYTIKYTKY